MSATKYTIEAYNEAENTWHKVTGEEYPFMVPACLRLFFLEDIIPELKFRVALAM